MASELRTRRRWSLTSSRRAIVLQTALVVVWGAAVGAALLALVGYSYKSGRVGEPPSASEAGIEVSAGEYTLVLAMHPKCPCTRATVLELERLMRSCRDRIRCVVYVYTPGEESWGGRDPFGIASRIPRVEVRLDPDGVVASRFGAFTSGSVVLYNGRGEVEFWGGITAGRGHAGDNLGSDSIRAIVLGNTPPRLTTPVYGCDLVTPGAEVEGLPQCCEVGNG